VHQYGQAQRDSIPVPRIDDFHCRWASSYDWDRPGVPVTGRSGVPVPTLSPGMSREGGTFSREFFTEPKAVVMAISPHDRG
jgi:hypothetical protein